MKRDRAHARVVLYHKALRHEGFEKTMEHITKLIYGSTQANSATEFRVLMLTVEGHRNKAGGLDKDMYDVVVNVLTYFMPFLSEFHNPLGAHKNMKPIRHDAPEFVTWRGEIPFEEEL